MRRRSRGQRMSQPHSVLRANRQAVEVVPEALSRVSRALRPVDQRTSLDRVATPVAAKVILAAVVVWAARSVEPDRSNVVTGRRMRRVRPPAVAVGRARLPGKDASRAETRARPRAVRRWPGCRRGFPGNQLAAKVIRGHSLIRQAWVAPMRRLPQCGSPDARRRGLRPPIKASRVRRMCRPSGWSRAIVRPPNDRARPQQMRVDLARAQAIQSNPSVRPPAETLPQQPAMLRREPEMMRSTSIARGLMSSVASSAQLRTNGPWSRILRTHKVIRAVSRLHATSSGLEQPTTVAREESRAARTARASETPSSVAHRMIRAVNTVAPTRRPRGSGLPGRLRVPRTRVASTV